MRWVMTFITLWIGLILEATVFQIPPMNAIHPDFVLVILVLVALMRGSNTAVVMAILIGLVDDVCYGSFIGLNAFAFGIVAYFAAAVFGQFLQRNLAITFFTTVALTFLHTWVTYGLMRLFQLTADPAHYALSQSLQTMIVNGVLVLLLYPVYVRLLRDRRSGRYDTRGSVDAS
ncbi:rod shape-determining protein MreD [Alicyclobacillus sacchari]|uniref:Rod shape-determining protein MreD n=1 Tax=Alicyclobacillus sacchari TaxID=392010 RepID=A0A4R8LIW0_9BACL|nr:rod shape-determining protein MreD [Alicyclobacillus sacchari]TDY43362.1 rod shape-determining protein MreD [Alicyclobacillus sacchari]GMA55899.1 hypothetical protein GCM10025858_04020 [Alicyclobacillus sacchari]